MSPTATRKAFSLVELVIVVVIIGVISAIAIPRLSRGSEGAQDSALRGNLAILRNGIEMFAAENGGAYPTVANFVEAMTAYSDGKGNTNATKTTKFIFGPYLKEVPALPVGQNKGNNVVAAADAAGVGWIYNDTTHEISANAGVAEADVTGTLYTAY